MTELDIQDLRKMSLGIGPISERAIALAFGNSMQPLENDLPLSLKGFLISLPLSLTSVQEPASPPWGNA